ncbi:uncharacterized protein [Diadema antillarum]|uniref:uncharacterized protein n=1 Tax=Diadema antillarum TaxID=105358 RepID=UPI003A840139
MFSGPCEEGEWTCSDSKCIPSYWRCDFYVDCADDEVNCGQDNPVVFVTLQDDIPRLFTSPGYPNHYAPKENQFWSITTLSSDRVILVNVIDFDLSLESFLAFGIEGDIGSSANHTAAFYHRLEPRQFLLDSNWAWMGFYPGQYGYSRGFSLQMTAIEKSAFTPGTCQPGEFQCATDGECILSDWRCDNFRDCAGGEDEESCDTHPPAGSCTVGNHQFQCNDGTCIHGNYVCDYIVDCSEAEEEVGCPCDKPGDYLCPEGVCIPSYFVCDWYPDCFDRSDEASCGSDNTTEIFALHVGETINITSPDYPGDFAPNQYYVYILQTNVGGRIELSISEFEVEIGGFLTIGNGDDPTNFNSALIAYQYNSNPTSVTSDSFIMWVEIHSGSHGFGRFFATAVATSLECEPDQYQCPEKCIPGSFRCDVWHDCNYGEDELECGHGNKSTDFILSSNAQVTFSSPNFSAPYVGSFYSAYWTFTADVEDDFVIHFVFHPYNISDTSHIAFGSGLDISNQSSLFNLAIGRTDLHNVYSPGKLAWVTFFNGWSEEAYPGFSATATVQPADAVPPMPSGCTRDQYDCGDGSQCIPGVYQCDNIHDCFNEGRDEQFCDFCTRFQFACPEKCIPSYSRCDFYHHCVNGEDEQGCGWDAIIEDRTFSPQQTLEFTSPLYPDPYPGNFSDFHYSFAVTDPAYHILFDFNFFSVNDLAVLIFGAGLDPSNFSSTLAIYHARDVPMRVYIPASEVWVTFRAGIEPGEGFQATVSAYTAGAIPPVTCAANQWACVDGQTCIPESYRCDGYHDCPSNGEDEHGCASACREYQFECRNGECLFEHRHCNGIADCSEGEDEVGCYDIGPCSPFQYQCANGLCIPEQQACDYFFDCPDGSDEWPQVCGECNALDEFSCNYGNCIPSYWVCDFYYDCLGGEDEFYCESSHGAGETTLAMHERYNITSPNWPDSPDPNIYQLWQISGPEGTVIHFDFLDYDLGLQSFLVVFDGHDVSNHSTEFAHSFYRFNPVILLSHTNQVSIAYHSGEYVGTRGFYISMVAVNPDHHHHPDCEDTAYQCAEDGECIPEYYYCDGFYDCLTGDDEYNCTYPERGTCGTYSSEYQCQGTDICIHADFRCDYRSDCPEHDDEFNCMCKEGEFSCPGTGQCLPAHLVCDFYYDCINSTADELACPEPELMLYQPNETQIITIQSPNYPNNYDARSYVVYLLQGPQDYRFIVRFNEYDVDWKGFLTFGSTLDYDDHDNAFSVYNHHAEPNMLYTPTNTFYIQFYGGPYGRSRGFQLTVQAVSIEDVPTQPPVPTCPAGDFTCFDGTCLPGIFECDGLTDCSPQGEDEHKCFASGGGCRSHQFTCNNGQCIHSDWRCDGISDCSQGEDEEGCPFQCFGVSQYTCVESEQCIPSFFQCDYYPDCTFGEDETDCGECTEGYFNCSDGACVPDYYVCDAYYDCLTRADEMNCGTPMNTNHIVLEEGEQHQIQSPGYPNMHDSLCYYLWIVMVPEGLYVHVIFQAFSVSIHTYMSLGSGSDPDNTTTRFAVYYHRTAPRETVIPSSVAWIEYHCGVYGDGRGFDVIIRPTNISTHVFPDCELGEVQCFDGHCIPSHFLCDTIRDCSMGEDEGHTALVNCTTYTNGACGNHETEFQCNDDACVHADYLCDNVRDCAEAEDELNCARNCTEFEFECPGGQCIPETERCDAYLNCINGIDDELNCGTPNNSVYIYLYLNSTNITSMNYPRPYPKNEYTVTYVATEPGYVIRATFNDLDLSVRSFLFFGNGDDISDFSNIFDGYTHRTAFPPFILSAGNQLYMEFHSGFYGGSQGYHIQFEAVDSADSVVTFPPCADGEFQCTNDGTCIRGDFECDLYHDCGDSSDEENCQAVGALVQPFSFLMCRCLSVVVAGTCQPHQFTCNDGQCIHESWECDGFEDCTGGEDEVSCGLPSCAENEYQCAGSGTCIPLSYQCDGYFDCFSDDDEENCEAVGENKECSDLTRAFTMNELIVGIKTMKNNKAAGLDDILCEQVKHLGPVALKWLLDLFNSCLITNKLPKIWRRAKIVAILKPAYDTVSHRVLVQKLYKITHDASLTSLIQNMLENRRFFVDLSGDRSRWRRQKNGLPQGSVLAPLLFNIYTNDQPIHQNTRSFLYADDLCIASQSQSFLDLERTLSEALEGLTTYYAVNHLRANPDKTQVSAFHLKSRDANRKLKVHWYGKRLEHIDKPVYLGVTLDRTLSFKDHVSKTKAKVGARNNILRKLANSKWGTDPGTIRSTALAMCYSAAEYACPVWGRSSHAKKLDPVLNTACTCLPHHFACDNGRCIASGLQCNLFDECGDGSDEDGCLSFACNRSEECIFRSQRCNYIANCRYGEDEEGCECPEGFYVCSNGGCIPPYYVCDGLPDCFAGQDERNCSGQGTAVTTSITLTDTSVVNVTSPNFPRPYGRECYHLWQFTAPPGLAVRFHFRSFELSIDSYLSIGSGPDPDNVTSILADYHYRYRPRERVVPGNEAWLEFHCGSFGGSRGFHIEVSAVDPSSHVHVECQTGEYRCTDNSCIPTFDLCNGVKNCPLAEDENENCANFSHLECGTHDDEWQCSFYCIHGYDRCDGFVDCILDLSDELNCTCRLGQFACGYGQCIPGAYRCDLFPDCLDGSDELECGHANNTEFVSITEDNQMVNISSPGYPDYAPAQDFMVTYVTVPEGRVVHATILDSEIATTAKIVFSDGHDDNKIFLEWVGHGSDVTNVTSFTNRMMIEFHTGFDGYSQFFISLSSAIPPEPMCTEEQFACIDRTCIPEFRECDGYPDCVNGEDEANCSAQGGTCAPHLFTCNDGRCITDSYRCDGYDDCENAEDEEPSMCSLTTDVP